jgi:hypothetical protein
MSSARAGYTSSPTVAAVVPAGAEPALASVSACLPAADAERDQGVKQDREDDEAIDSSARGDADGLIHSEPIDRRNRTIS